LVSNSTIVDALVAHSMGFILNPTIGSWTEEHKRGELGIHLLVGKLRRPQQSDQTSDDSAEPRYYSLWAYIRMDHFTLRHHEFMEAVEASITALIVQERDNGAVTLLYPIGRYIS
jgi:hypothetical protein